MKRQDPDAATVGVVLFLLALGMLFVTSLVGYGLIRSRAQVWPPPGTPPLPGTMWAGTILLLAASGAIHLAHRRHSRGDGPAAVRLVWVTLALGAAFVVCQATGWVLSAHQGLVPRRDLYAFTYYMLTGLHAVHAAAGLVPLALILTRAAPGVGGVRISPNLFHTALYWHFVDGVWLVVFLVLVLGS